MDPAALEGFLMCPLTEASITLKNEIMGWNATYRLKNPEEPTYEVIVKRLQRKSKKYANVCSKLPVSTRHVDAEKRKTQYASMAKFGKRRRAIAKAKAR